MCHFFFVVGLFVSPFPLLIIQLDFTRIYITLDDNAQYGFNIAEANQLRQLVQQLGLQNEVAIYPGADEVQLTMLSHFSVDTLDYSPKMYLVFRDPNKIENIPNYEGRLKCTCLLHFMSICSHPHPCK